VIFVDNKTGGFKMKKCSLIFIFCVLFLFDCATNLPMTSSLNDFVMMGTKVNSTEKVNFTYESKIIDCLIKPYNKDKEGEITSHPGFNQTESSTLGRMLNEYFGNKFTQLNQGGDSEIKVVLQDFWIEQYSTDSQGQQLLAAFVGGEINTMCIAKVKVLLIVTKNSEESTKIISTSSEDSYVQGIGTGTSTSNIYRGKESLEYIHARNINKANNKIIMMINSYLEELGF